MKIIIQAGVVVLIMAVIAAAYIAGGGKIPISVANRAMMEDGLKDLDFASNAPFPKKLSEDPEFIAFKDGVESGLLGLANADKSTREKIDVLSNEIVTVKKDFVELKKGFDGILNPPKKEIEPVYLRELAPNETERLSAIFSQLPNKLEAKQYGMTLILAKDLIESGFIKELMQVLAVLSAQGEKVCLCIGRSDNGPAPAWIEVEKDGLYLLCKGLSFDGYKGLKDRSTLPEKLRLPAYVLKYDNCELHYFGVCETYQSKSY